jgi:hypothetical protein
METVHPQIARISQIETTLDPHYAYRASGIHPASDVTLSEAKGLAIAVARSPPRFFAEFTLSAVEGLRMTLTFSYA